MAFNKYGYLEISTVNQLDNIFGFEIPMDYKDFLVNTNGGRFDFEDEHFFVLENASEKIWIDVLYGNKENRRSSLMFWNNEYGDEIPEKSIIIGDTQNHGFLVYVCLNSAKGIYYWDDCFSIKGSGNQKNAYFIANDMNKLLEKIGVSNKKTSFDKKISDIDEKIGENNILYRTPDENKLQVIDAIAFKQFMHPCDKFVI